MLLFIQLGGSKLNQWPTTYCALATGDALWAAICQCASMARAIPKTQSGGTVDILFNHCLRYCIHMRHTSSALRPPPMCALTHVRRPCR
jgi:hypothetical protein